MSRDHFDRDSDAEVWRQRACNALSLVVVMLCIVTWFVARECGNASVIVQLSQP